ncbi:MAG TPA: exlusion protein FxsA, partial [Chromatiaceae bacterium]|nr:exlusion protein FxsA [Chromatiaceae bacterium]
LLLTPGFFTDALGFLCLIPSSRRKIAQYILKKWLIQQPPAGPGSSGGEEPRIIEGEYQRRE